ncbi:DUF4239 domain-containing protein [Kitasatospora sp. LaBMicrA B282]|uniref:bestrophin-like domain n=1 Tax=Kitasatospora sp. LaBMicrA B282 TaxID=3420949 RepID=UPI003D137E46
MNYSDYLILFGSLVLVTVVLLGLNRFFPHTTRLPQNDVAGFIFAVVGVIYAVLLAFVVIAVWENTDAAKATTFREADALAGVYWMSRQMPLPMGAHLEDDTLKYAHAVMDDEWGLMRHHQSDPHATQLMYDMRDTTMGFQPSNAREQVLYDHAVTGVEQLASERRSRLNEIEDLVPPLLWIALILGAVLTVGFSFLFGLSNTWAHLAMVLTLTVLVSISLIAVKEMDYPFSGVNEVKPTSFEVFLSRLPPERTA